MINTKENKVGVAMLMSDKIDLEKKTGTSDKEAYNIMTKESILQEDITIVNIHATNIRALKYIKQMENDNSTIVGYFKMLL